MIANHYAPKEVSKVDSKDSRVCLLGKVVSSRDNSFVLDDGTGKIEINSEFMPVQSRLVRVFCTVENERLKADIVQDVEGLDMNLLKKVNALYNSAGV